MDFSLASRLILLLALFFYTIACHPRPSAHPLSSRAEGHNRQAHHYALERHAAPKVPTQSVTTTPTDALTTRSHNTTARPRVVYVDLTFLVPSQRNALLLSKIYNELRTAALDAARDLEPAANLVLRVGKYSFTVVCLERTFGLGALVDYALFILEQLALATYPLTFSLVVITAEGLVFWAAGFLD